MIWLQCFGSPALLSRPPGGAESVLLPAGKPLLVLAILATRFPARVFRDELAILGWGNHDEIHAKGSLRQALYRIRQTLGNDALDADDHSARLVAALPGDWPVLTAAVAAGDDRALLHGMNGGFLDGIEHGDREEPGDWVSAERTRWALLLQAAALREGRRALGLGEVDTAIGLAERALAIHDDQLAGWDLYLDALRATSSATRLEGGLARLEAAGQNGLLAVADPSIWKRLAQRHRRALDELRRGSSDESEQTTAGVLPFTGRAALLEHLLTLLTRPVNGYQPAIALVAGPGFGKSRMLHEIRMKLAGRGVMVAQVEAIASEASSPWALLNRVVVALAALPGAVGVDPRAAAHLVALDPRLRERFPGVTTSANPSLPGDAELTAAVAELIGAVGEARHLVLLIDDLHWGDERSMAAIHGAFLLPQSGSARCLGTTRDDAPKQFRDCQTLHLPSLTVEGLESLIASSLPAIAAADRTAAANAMMLVTGGVPHYVARAVQRLAMLEPPAPGQDDDHGSRILAAIPSLELYRDPALPTAGLGHSILEYLGIVGEPVGIEELRVVLGQHEPSELDPMLETLRQRGSISMNRSSIRLSHDLVLQQVVESISAERRRMLELQRANWLVAHGVSLHELQRAVRIYQSHGLKLQILAAVRTWRRRWPGTARGRALADLLLPPRHTPLLRWQMIAAATPAPLWRLALTGGLLLLAAWTGVVWLRQPTSLRSENAPRVQPTDEGLKVVRNMEPPLFTIRDRIGRISTRLDGESLRVVGMSPSLDSLHLNPLPVVRNGLVSADSLEVFTGTMDSLQITFQVGALPPHTLTVFRGFEDQSLAIMGGRINGVVLDSVHPEVTVGPGDSLVGRVLLRYTTPAQAALWMLAETSTMEPMESDTTTVMTLHTGAPRAIAEIRLLRRAPLTPGKYWLVWAFAAEPSAVWILSLTNWRCGTPHWHDGNDLLTLPDSMLEHAWGGGVLTTRREICDAPGNPTWQPMHYPAATLRVTVREGDE